MDFLLVVIVIDLDHDLIDLLYTFLLFSYWKHLLHFIFSNILLSPGPISLLVASIKNRITSTSSATSNAVSFIVFPNFVLGL